MINIPTDREMQIRKMKHDLFGSINELDRCVTIARKMLHDLRFGLIKIGIAEDEMNRNEEDEEQ